MLLLNKTQKSIRETSHPRYQTCPLQPLLATALVTSVKLLFMYLWLLQMGDCSWYTVLVCNQLLWPTLLSPTLTGTGNDYLPNGSGSFLHWEGNHRSGIALAMHSLCGIL